MSSTPEFILDILNDELRSYHIILLEKVATKHKLDLNELISDFLEESAKIIPKNKISINIEKKLEPRTPPVECRCMARIWGRGKGGQCTRKCSEKSEYCIQHVSERKHGRIDESIPKDKFPQKTKCLYK